MEKSLSPRWVNTTQEQRTNFASRRAHEKNKLMTEDERKAHALKMVKARGSWVIVKGKKVYVRNKSKSKR